MVFVVIAAALFGAYVVGSVPTGYWFAKYYFNVDVRKFGSGNTGATNVARVLGHVKYFFLIFFIDAGKALLTLWLMRFYAVQAVGQAWQLPLLCLTATMLLIGNGYSIFLRGRGGKSVATLIGCVTFLFPWIVIAVMLTVWGVVFGLDRRVFVASISASLAATTGYWCCCVGQHGVLLGVFLTLATVWLVWRHTSNIKQLFTKA
jgi:acyl phosphate:glycerol-3-phosphate acyltransferase